MSELVMRADRLGVPYTHDGKMWVRAIAHAALTAGQPYAVHPDKDSIAVTAAPATLAVLHFVGAPQKAFASGDIATLQIGGEGTLLVDGTSAVAASDYLEVINGGTAAIKDATTRSVNCIAMAMEAQASASAVLTDVIFLSLPVQVAAA